LFENKKKSCYYQKPIHFYTSDYRGIRKQELDDHHNQDDNHEIFHLALFYLLSPTWGASSPKGIDRRGIA
jgi:hypothetical protein